MGSLSVLPMHIERSAICEDRRGKPYRTRAERGGKTLEGAGFAAARGAAILRHQPRPRDSLSCVLKPEAGRASVYLHRLAVHQHCTGRSALKDYSDRLRRSSGALKDFLGR